MITMAKYERKKWKCGTCGLLIEFNSIFFNEVKARAKKDWNDMNNLEKADWREHLQNEGLYPTILVDSGRAHLCDVKSIREEIELLKLDIKKVQGDIESIANDLSSIKQALVRASIIPDED